MPLNTCCRIVFFTLFIFTGSRLYAQPDLISSINSHIVSINQISPNDNIEDLTALEPFLKEKNIIGIGESSHGTKEYFLFKNQLIRYFTEKLEFRNIIVEADFSGARLMNEYIQNGKGDPYSALKAMNIGFLMNQEFLDFIEWLKSYNKNKTSADQIKFWGCDMMLPQTALKSFENGSIPVENPLTEKSKQTIGVILNWNFRQPDASEQADFKRLLTELKNLKFKTSDDRENALYQQYISNIEQCLINLMERSWFQRSINRDKFMAQNVEWIYRSNQQKSIVWAHNEHIAKNITENNNLPMGNYLGNDFKDQYYALGLAFGSGTVRAVLPNEQHSSVITLSEVTVKNSADQLFSKCHSENFFLNLSPDNSDNLFNNFLNTKLYTRSVGSLFRPGKDDIGTSIYRPLKTIYDGIFFIRHTTAASPQLPEIKYN